MVLLQSIVMGQSGITNNKGGTYVYLWALSATSGDTNKTFEFTIVNDTTPGSVIRRKFANNTDVGAMAGFSMIEAKAGDHLSVGVRCITDASDLTLNKGQFLVFKIN